MPAPPSAAASCNKECSPEEASGMTFLTDKSANEIRALDSLSNGRPREDGSSDSGGKLHFGCLLYWTGGCYKWYRICRGKGEGGERCIRYVLYI